MRTHCLILFFCLAIAMCPAVFADDGARYTLNELCRAANETAQEIRIAEDDVAIARQEKQRARSVLVPRATTFASHSNYKNADMFSPDTTSMGVKLTQSFTLNGRELIAYDVAKKGIETNAYTLEAVRSDYLLQVVLAYFQTLEAKRLQEIAQADVLRLETHKQAVEEKLRVGSVTRTDLFRAEAELSRAMSDQVTAYNAVIQNKDRIVRLTGIDDRFFISEKDVQGLDKFDPALAQIQALALENRFEIKAAQKNLEIADQTIQYEKGDFWPALNLETGYRESDISYTSSPADTDYDTEEAYAKAELVFTLYDGGLRRAQVRQAEARKRQARQALARVKNDIILESRVAFSEYETAKNTLINLQDELKSAQENHNAVQMQYQYGMADIVDMMDANTLLAQSERRISNARYTLFQTIYKLLYTQGKLPAYVLR
ncbi:MAG: TolC family protein [Desulfotignum sp.]|nr:TolC family protein [Desulfotignum sp.]